MWWRLRCSACADNVKKGAWFHGCRPCDYDLCDPCYLAFGAASASEPPGALGGMTAAMGGMSAVERGEWANGDGVGLGDGWAASCGSVHSLAAHGDPPLALLAATAALLGEPHSVTRAAAAAQGATLASALEAVAEKLGVPRLLDANEFPHEECVLLFLAELVGKGNTNKHQT